MRKIDDGEEKKKKEKKEKEKKRMAFLVATTSLPAVYCPNGYARTTTAGTPHARANMFACEKRRKIQYNSEEYERWEKLSKEEKIEQMKKENKSEMRETESKKEMAQKRRKYCKERREKATDTPEDDEEQKEFMERNMIASRI